MRALPLLAGAAVVAAALAACDGDVTEPPFLAETSPTADVEATPTADPAAELESFRAFAALIDDAVATGDGSLIEDRALPSIQYWVGDAGGAESPQRVRAVFEEIVSEAMPDEEDEFGSGEAKLYALARGVQGPRCYRETIYQAILTALTPKPGYKTQQGPDRVLAVYDFALRDGRWRLVTVLINPYYNLDEAMAGEHSECYDHWERWEGTP